MAVRFSGSVFAFGAGAQVSITVDEGPFQTRISWGNGVTSPWVAADDESGMTNFNTSYATQGTFTGTITADFGGGVVQTEQFFVRLAFNATVPVTLTGGAKTDLIAGGSGNDNLSGLAGDDYLFGGNGNDKLAGGVGRDTLEGGFGSDTIYGGDGDDFLMDVVGNGNDSMDGGNGNDVIYAGLGNDRATGGNGNDFILGNEGNDYLTGDAGNDELSGGAGADTLVAGAGRDRLIGGPGGDRIVLSADGVTDTVHFRNYAERGDFIVGFESGKDKLSLAFVSSANFAANGNPVASNGNTWLLYDTDDGKLYVDMDGTGAQAAVVLATMVGVPTLAASDFIFFP